MPRRTADSLKVFKKEYVFSFSDPEDRVAIRELFSGLRSGKFTESDVSKATRIGYDPEDEDEFEEVVGDIPETYHSWVKPWTKKETKYLVGLAEESEESDLLQRSLDEKDARIAELLEEVQEGKMQLRRLEDTLKEYRGELDESDATFRALAKTEATLKAAQQRNQTLTAQLEQQKLTGEEQEQEIAQLTLTKEDLAARVSTLSQEIAHLRAENTQDREFFDEATADMDKARQKEIKDLTRQIDELKSSHAKELLAQRNQLDAQISTLRQETGLINQRLKEAEELLQAGEGALAAQQKEMDALIADHRQQIEAMGQPAQSLEEQLLNARLQEILQEKQSVIETMQVKVTSATKDLSALQKEHTQLQHQAESLEIRNTALSAEITELKEAARQTATVLKDAKRSDTHLHEELERTAASLASADGRLTQLQEERATLVESHEGVVATFKQHLSEQEQLIARLHTEMKQALLKEQGAVATVARVEREKISTTEELQALRAAHAKLQTSSRDLGRENTELATKIRGKEAELQAAEQAKARLTDKLAAARERLSTAQRDLTSQKAESAELHERAATLASENATLVAQMAEKEAALQEAEMAITSLTGKRNAAIERLSRAQSDLTSQQAESAELRKHAATLERDKGELSAQISTLGTAIAEKDAELKAALNTNKSLTAEIDEAKKDVLTAKRSLAELQSKHSGLERENTGLSKQIEENKAALQAAEREKTLLTAEHDAVAKRLATAETKNAALSDQVAALQRGIETKTSELQIAAREKESLAEELLSAEKRLLTAERDLTALRQQNSRLQELATTVGSENEVLLKQIGAKEAALQAAESEKARLTHELAVVTTSLATVEGENATLVAQMAAKKEELQAAGVAITSLTAERNEARKHLATAESSLGDLGTRYKELKTHAATLKSENERLVAQMAEKEAALRAAESEKARLTHELAVVTTSLVTAERSFADLQAERDQLKDRASKLESDHVRLLEQISKNEEALRIAEKENAAITKQLVTAKESLSEAEKSLVALRESMEGLVKAHRLEISGLHEEVRELHTALSREQGLNAELHQTILTAEGEAKAARLREASISKELEGSRADNAGLKDRLKESSAENARLRETIEQLRARIQQLEKKAVAPLRDGSDSGHEDSGFLSPDPEHQEGNEADVALESVLEALTPRPAAGLADLPAVDPLRGEEEDEEEEEEAAVEEEEEEEAEEAEEEEAAEPLPPIAAAFWSLFLQKGGAMSGYFQDQLVKKGEAPKFEAWSDDELGARMKRATRPLYQLVEIRKGDFIHSTAEFKKEGGKAGEKVMGKLVQDHTGRVIDKTTDKLSESQQCIMALRQAEMILNNFKPTGKGDDAIIIEGNASNAERGNRLVAALLLLKDHPEHSAKLKDIKIISKVPGCKVPEPDTRMLRHFRGERTQEGANRKFIEKYLPADPAMKELHTRVQTQVGDFAATKAKSLERAQAMKQALHDGRAHAMSEEDMRAAQRAIDDATISPGDIIGLDGKKL